MKTKTNPMSNKKCAVPKVKTIKHCEERERSQIAKDFYMASLQMNTSEI